MSGRITVGRVLDSSIDSVEATQGTDPWQTRELTGLVPAIFDHVSVSYDGLNRITSAVYRTGGAGGTIVASLAITYAGASQRIASVTRT